MRKSIGKIIIGAVGAVALIAGAACGEDGELNPESAAQAARAAANAVNAAQGTPVHMPISAPVSPADAVDVNPLQGLVANDALADRDAEIARQRTEIAALKTALADNADRLRQERNLRLTREGKIGELTAANTALNHEIQAGRESLTQARQQIADDSQAHGKALGEAEARFVNSRDELIATRQELAAATEQRDAAKADAAAMREAHAKELAELNAAHAGAQAERQLQANVAKKAADEAQANANKNNRRLNGVIDAIQDINLAFFGNYPDPSGRFSGTKRIHRCLQQGAEGAQVETPMNCQVALGEWELLKGIVKRNAESDAVRGVGY